MLAIARAAALPRGRAPAQRTRKQLRVARSPGIDQACGCIDAALEAPARAEAQCDVG